nr:hypothetical protein [Glycomyces arizonensis]
MKTVFSGGVVLRNGAAAGFPGPGQLQQRFDDGAVLAPFDARTVVAAVEIEPAEADLVEDLPVRVGHAPVDRLRVGEELQERLDRLAGLHQFGGVGSVELFVDGGLLESQVADLGGEFVGGPVRVSDQFHVLVFLCFEAASLACQLVAHGLGGAFLGFEHGGQMGPDLISLGRSEGDGRPVDRDVVFDGGHREPRQVAFAVGATQAQVVEVEPPGLRLAALDGQALLAASAADQTFEEVVPFALAHPRLALLVEHLLDPFQQLGGHQRLVPPVVLASFVGNLAEVVAVPQDPAQGVHRDGCPGRITLGRSGAQPGGGGGLAELREGVLPRRVPLEQHPHQRRSLRIGHDGAPGPSFDGLDRVEVAQSGAVRRPAALGLGLHLVGDVVSGGL